LYQNINRNHINQCNLQQKISALQETNQSLHVCIAALHFL
jgi:hypothetical protein